jgi:photosystem II stability/assembly factor-like uncharacterized protein
MRNPAGECSAQMSFPRRGSGKVPDHSARIVFVVLCLLVVAGCGTSTPVVSRAPTPTPATTSVPTTVMGSVTSVHLFDATTGWATANNRLLRTTDGGLHWQDVTPPGSGPQGVAAFPLSADDAWVVRVLVDGGPAVSPSTVFHTADGGRTWHSILLPVFLVAQITFADSQHGWILANLDTGGGQQAADIFRSTDGGQTWSKVSSAADRPGALPLDGQKFGLTFRDATTGWVVQGDPLGPVPRLHGLFRTQDGGSTWQPAPTLPWPAALVRDPSLDEFGQLPTFFSPQVGVLRVLMVAQTTGDVADTVMYVTRDGGMTWSPTTPLQASAVTTSFRDVTSFLDPLNWWIVPNANANGGTSLFETSDGGQHWASWTPGPPFVDVSALSFGSNTLGLAIGSAGLLQTTDGGHTWITLAPAPPPA